MEVLKVWCQTWVWIGKVWKEVLGLIDVKWFSEEGGIHFAKESWK